MKYKIMIGVIAVIFLAGVAGSVIVLHMPKKDTVQIKSGGKALYTLDLSREKDRVFTVTAGGGENTIEIKDGAIRVKDADCPDKTCVRMGWLRSSAMPIVCLPHGLVIEYVDGGDSGVDAITE